MCGIAGYFRKDDKPAEPDILRAMASAMRQRGPDGEGVYTDGPLGLAHRRLSIIDLTGGAQPMTTEDGALTVVFNGEIFNFRELRREMEGKGIIFRTKSDTEVIPELYRLEGESFVRRLNGFFAFALYDRTRRKLLLARDRIGVKPLFYLQNPETFAFASTLNALKQLPGFENNELNPEAIADFLAFQYIPGERTAFQNVHRLPPGVLLEFDLISGAIVRKSFAETEIKKTELSYPDAKQALRELVMDAVERRLVADVPLGVFLSGGLDSAIISGAAAKLMKTPLECFSIGFRDPAYDESSLAAQSAEFIRSFASIPVNFHTKTVNPCDFQLLEELAGEFGEPYADASMLPTSLLSRFTRESVTVALSGDGADELFGGYDRYRAMALFQSFPIPACFCKAVLALLPSGGERTFSGRLRRFLCAASLEPEKRYRFIMTHGADDLIAASKGPKLNIGSSAYDEYKPHGWDETWYPAEKDLHTYLPGDVLRKVDTCSMASSLEVRSPFLDYRVAEFAATLPREWKIRSKQRKRILVDAFSDLIPADLGTRKKRGFGVPVASWFRHDWNAPLKDRLFSGKLDDFIQRKETERLLAEHESGRQDHSYWLFSLLILEFFLERFPAK